MLKIYFASDHAGFELKGKLITFVKELGYETEDFGARSFSADDDYPDFIIPLAKRIASEPDSKGIIIGRSGQGEAMCANRVPGVRAAVFYASVPCLDVRRPDMKNGVNKEENDDIIQLAREHNNANVLSLGAQFISFEEAKDAVKRFMELPFSDSPRHARRLAKF